MVPFLACSPLAPTPSRSPAWALLTHANLCITPMCADGVRLRRIFVFNPSNFPREREIIYVEVASPHHHAQIHTWHREDISHVVSLSHSLFPCVLVFRWRVRLKEGSRSSALTLWATSYSSTFSRCRPGSGATNCPTSVQPTPPHTSIAAWLLTISVRARAFGSW
jgi:hypothetical protein